MSPITCSGPTLAQARVRRETVKAAHDHLIECQWLERSVASDLAKALLADIPTPEIEECRSAYMIAKETTAAAQAAVRTAERTAYAGFPEF